jgi:hypothetical protein
MRNARRLFSTLQQRPPAGSDAGHDFAEDGGEGANSVESIRDYESRDMAWP